MESKHRYVAFLRGINVGGHNKIPMAHLRKAMESLGFNEVRTLLNSGNILFNTTQNTPGYFENSISAKIKSVFGFEVPVLVVDADELLTLKNKDPFSRIKTTPETRLYVTFIKSIIEKQPLLPYSTEDKSFQILEVINHAVCSVLDLSKSSSIKGMDILEKQYGKEITTRNWNTIEKIIAIL